MQEMLLRTLVVIVKEREHPGKGHRLSKREKKSEAGLIQLHFQRSKAINQRPVKFGGRTVFAHQ